jgi:ATP-dependent helicase/nuclease subunit B
VGLRKLEPLEKTPDAAERGTLIHGVMDDFIAACPDIIPADARNMLIDFSERRLARRADSEGVWDFWRPRFERIAGWIVDNETEWRASGAKPLRTEIEGRMSLPGAHGDFTLTVRADRIDRLSDGSYALIDYKSGGSFSAKKIQSGAAPQLPLEGLILQQGGFTELAPGEPGYFGYWIITGGSPPGDTKEATKDLPQAMENARQGLTTLIAMFDNPATPYFSIPDPDRAPRFNDYEQLSRLQEWTALDETSAEDAA